MNLEDNFSDEHSEQFSRMDLDPLSLYDTNSRDSGFEEVPLESLGDDQFLEEFAEINFTENSKLPTDFCNLIQKPIVSITNKKTTFQRAFSLEENVSPLKKKICQRPEENDEEFHFIRRKRVVRKFRTEESQRANQSEKSQLQFVNSEEVIKSAIQRSYSEPDLVGDFSRSYCLPLTVSRHQDLRGIDSTTLRRLLNGEFSDRVRSFRIIDCRYPYEYNGGHISGAINMYTHEQCSSLLEAKSEMSSGKADILIFHCEFSAERGPNLYRHLRKEDRMKNADSYPFLNFPEMYILEGGYRKFFEDYSECCTPESYTQMLDPKHSEDLKSFRQISKTYNSDVRSTCKRNSRLNIKKLNW